VVWRAGGERRDLNHVNSVGFSGGHLICAGFGPKNGPAWSDAYDGFIYDLQRMQYVARGLFHPHSLVDQDDLLYFCESAEGSFRTVAGPVRYLDGYSRGLAIRGEHYYAGASRGRRANGLERYVLNPADAGVRSGRCALYVGAFGDRSQPRIIDLGKFAEEIYDVLLVPEPMNAAI
jgi:hypothetical protein